MLLIRALALLALAASAFAADYPAPKEATWIVRDFRFHTGEVLPELRLHYTTVGDPSGEPVVLLHGTTQSGSALLAPTFAGELFGAGQPLDATRYYVILPDAIGHGKSSKPSDGLRTRFPRYNYSDLVEADQRLVSEHLGIKRLRLVLGNSMGGMETWLWSQDYPRMMDVAVPMASLPVPMAGRNWIMRRLIIDSIRRDPASAQFASVFYAFATNGGNQALYKAAPTRDKADAVLEARLKAPWSADPEDVLYQWDSSRDYDPSAGLERIEATLLAINSSDDERNPPELGVLDREIKRVKHGRVLLIPGSADTAGHGTTANAKWWKKDLDELLRSAPRLEGGAGG
jgi:homoserine O-acetyltransferase